jgi:hypothetical protein
MELIVAVPEGQLPRAALGPVIGTVVPVQELGLHVFVVVVHVRVEDEHAGEPVEPDVNPVAQDNVQAVAP